MIDWLMRLPAWLGFSIICLGMALIAMAGVWAMLVIWLFE